MHLIYESMHASVDLNSFELRSGRESNLFRISSLQADAFVVQLHNPTFLLCIQRNPFSLPADYLTGANP